MLFSLFLGLACSQEQPAATPPPQQVQVPATVSIRRLRGVLLRDGATLAFRPCGEEELLAVQGAAVGDLEEVYGSLAETDPAAIIGVELTGAVREAGEGRVLDAAALAVALPPGQGGLCAYDASYSYQARGQEPFWAITVSEELLTYASPELEAPIVMRVTPTRRPGGAISFAGELQGHHVDLSLQFARCRDDMSGAVYPLTATALVDGGSLRGCAQEGWTTRAR